jgi:hypothetical protein
VSFTSGWSAERPELTHLFAVTEYFGCVDIIRALKEAGAVQARALCRNPGEYSGYGPREWDQSFVEEFVDEVDRSFTEAQPFWHGHWDLLYDLMDD